MSARTRRRVLLGFLVVGVALLAVPPGAAAQGGAETSDGFGDLGRQWLAGDELPVDTTVESQELSSYGNEPAIPAGEISLDEVLLTSTPIAEGAPPDFETLLRQLGAPGCGQSTATSTTLCGPAWSLQDLPPASSFVLAGGRFAGPLPISGPRDFLFEIGVEIMDPSVGPPWQADPQFPNDYLQDLNSCFPYYYRDGAWVHDGFLAFTDPENYPDPVPRPVVTVIDEDSFLTIFPQPPDATSIRLYGFKTSLASPYQPDSVVASVYPSITAGPLPFADVPTIFDVTGAGDPADETTTSEADDPEDSAAMPAADEDDGGGPNPVVIGAIGLGVVALGTGAWLKLRPTPVPAAPTGGASAPRDAGDDFMDAFAGAFGGGQTTTRTDDASDAAWAETKRLEDAVQQRIHDDFEKLATDVGTALAAFDDAVDRYQSKYALVSSASTRLQGLLTAWAESKTIAQRADLAFAVATILWTGGAAGVRALRWVARARSGPAAVGAADDAVRAGAQVADELAAGDTAVGTAWAEAPTVIDRAPRVGDTAATVVTGAGRGAAGSTETIALYREAAEAGIDVEAIMARHAATRDSFGRKISWDEAVVAAEREILPLLAAARGWVRLEANTIRLVTQLLTDGRLAVAGTGPGVAADGLTILREMAEQPGFWEQLARAMDEITYGVDAGADGLDAIHLLFTADDIQFLKLLLETGGDVDALRKARGPVRVTALAATTAAPTVGRAGGGGTGAAAWGALPGTAGAGTVAGQVLDPGSPLDQAGGLEGALQQLGDEAGGPAGTGKPAEGLELLWQIHVAIGDVFWDFFTSPTEQTVDWFYTWEGIDALEDLLQDHGDDLLDMGDALNDAVDALEKAAGAIGAAGLTSPSSTLGGRGEAELNDVLDEYRDTIDGASEDWKDAHDDEIAETLDHIQTKLADLRVSLDAFRQMQARLPIIAQWLESLQTVTAVDPATGERRTAQRGVLGLFNPEVFVRMAAIRRLLSTIGATGFLLDSAGPVSPPFPESSEETSRIQQEAMRQRIAEIEAAEASGTGPEMPDFGDLPPADGD